MASIIVRDDGLIIDSAVADMNFATGFSVVPVVPGIVTIQIQADAITTTLIAPNAITTAKIADLNVTLAKLAANSVDSSKIVDGSIVNADINAAAGIVGSKLANDTITATQLATNAVTTVKITDGNVTTAKLAANSVDSSKIIDGSIVNADVNASAAIAFSKLSGVAALVHSHTPIVVTRTADSTTGTGVREVGASCLAGEEMVGGGCEDTLTSSLIYESSPRIAGTWRCESTNGSSHTITAYVLCLTTPIS